MNEDEIRKFVSDYAGREFIGTLVTVKQDGYAHIVTKDGIQDLGYRFTLVAYIKEFPCVVVQEDSWSEDAIKEEARISYQCMAKHCSKEGITLPKLRGFEIQYVDIEEFLKK